MTAVTRRLAYEATVDRFEQALCDYTGSPLCVATDCCTDALFLSLLWFRSRIRRFDVIRLPRWNYVGVYQATINAGWEVEWTDEQWTGGFLLEPLPVIDSAKRFERGMYEPGTLTCVSFGSSKRLPIGRGGAILLDNQEAADWIRPRSMDGRTSGEDYQTPRFATPGHRMNMTPEQAARGLDLLTYIDDPPSDTWESYPDLSKADWL